MYRGADDVCIQKCFVFSAKTKTHGLLYFGGKHNGICLAAALAQFPFKLEMIDAQEKKWDRSTD